MSDVAMVVRFTIDEQAFALPLHNDVMLGLTPREHQFVDKLCGVRGGQNLWDGLRDVYVPLLVALAIVAAERAGQKPDADAIYDGKSKVTFVYEDPDPPPVGDADAAPPSTSPTPTTHEGTGTP